MTMIEERLKATILEALGLDDYPITARTIAPEVPGWDSLSHVIVLTTVEKEYGVRFRANEAMNLANVGALQDLVDRKLAQKAA
jgi:acyl carrier protein